MSAEEFQEQQEPQEQQEQSVESVESEQSPSASAPEPAGEVASPETAHGLAVGSFTAAAFAVMAIFIAWGLLVGPPGNAIGIGLCTKRQCA